MRLKLVGIELRIPNYASCQPAKRRTAVAVALLNRRRLGIEHMDSVSSASLGRELYGSSPRTATSCTRGWCEMSLPLRKLKAEGAWEVEKSNLTER